DAEVEQGPDGPIPEIPRRPIGKGSRGLPEVLRGVSALPQGRRGYRLCAQGSAGQTAALRVVFNGQGQADFAGGLRQTHAIGAEGDILPAHAESGGGGQQSLLRGVQGTEVGSAVPL